MPDDVEKTQHLPIRDGRCRNAAGVPLAHREGSLRLFGGVLCEIFWTVGGVVEGADDGVIVTVS